MHSTEGPVSWISRFEPLRKDRTEMEIVISFKIYQTAAANNQLLQGIQNGIKLP